MNQSFYREYDLSNEHEQEFYKDELTDKKRRVTLQLPENRWQKHKHQIYLVVSIVIVFIITVILAVGLITELTKEPDAPANVIQENAVIPLKASINIMIENPTGEHTINSGSGFIYSYKNTHYVITAKHNYDGQKSVVMKTITGNTYLLEYIGNSELNDVAIFKVRESVPEEEIESISFSESVPEIGERIYVVGSPFNFYHTVTEGIISGHNRAAEVNNAYTGNTYTLYDVLQTDASINPGNSGGMALNKNGEVIGMVNAIWAENGVSVGIGFITPGPRLEKITQNIIEGSPVLIPTVGLSITEYTTEGNYGLVVGDVENQSIAAKIQKGDLITHANNQRIYSVNDFISQVYKEENNKEIKLTILKRGLTQQEITLPIVLKEETKQNKITEEEMIIE